MEKVFNRQAGRSEVGDEPTWGETFNGVRRALRHLKTPKEIVAYYLSDNGLFSRIVEVVDWPLSAALAFFSEVKAELHTNIDFLDVDWKFYLDLQNLAGYPDQKVREMKDDPHLWLSTPVMSQYDAGWWKKAFEDTYLQQNLKSPGAIFTLEQFTVRRWLWVTNGATSASKATLDDERVKTKFGAALSLSDEELLSLVDMSQKRNASIGVFLKPDEMGYKRRLIANVSLGGYIVAAYIRYVLESFLGTKPSFLKLETNFVDTMDVITLIRKRRLLLPLDESAYDYHVSKESWLGFFSFLRTMFPENEGVTKLELMYHMSHWHTDDKEGKWLSGMPSGLALTSYVNSWMNYIKQKFLVPGDLQWAAGDDVLVAPYQDVELQDLAAQYARFGSSINALKNWKSRRYAEYLKVLYHANGTTGYPARVYASLIWAGVDRSFLPSDRLPELAELFKQYYDRCGRPLDERVVASDLSRAVSHKVIGFNSVVAKEWLHSPRAYGGFGCLPYNNTVFEWKAEVMKRKKYENVIIRVPDVNFYSDKVALVKRTERLHTNVSVRTGPPLRLREPSTIQDWEDRLNGVDNPVKGKYGRMALDVIPLPTIDGVSTAAVAGFAAKYGFNVYPNLVGTTSRINSRLVIASIMLAQLVKKEMRDHDIHELAN